MVVYNVTVRPNKSIAKCRICEDDISVGTLCLFVSVDDSFSVRLVVFHCDCVLSLLIKEMKTFKQNKLKEQLNALKQFEKLKKVIS